MAREVDLGSIMGPKGDLGKSTGYTTVEPAGGVVAKASVNAGQALNVDDLIVAPSGKLWKITGKDDPTNYNVEDTTISLKGPKGDAGATDADGVTYDETNVGAALDDIFAQLADIQYVKIAISSFTNNVNTVEMGSTVESVVLNWATNKKPKSQTIDGEVVDVSLKTKTIENANIKTNKTYTLRVTDDRDAEASRTTSITFLNGVYYGSAAAESELNNALILGLQKTLQGSKGKTFTTNCGAEQKIFYAIPSRYGTPAFKVGGFDGGFEKAGTIEFTNASGYKENYDIWRSDNKGLGNTTVVVS